MNSQNSNEMIKMNDDSAEITLTNINDNCLEHIFKYLDLQSLINIAETNKSLKPSADLAFKRNFGKMTLSRFSYDSIRRNWIDKISISIFFSEKMIQIYDFPTYLKCVRYFGHLFTKLIIDYDIGPCRAMVDQYFHDYCVDFVTEVEFNWMLKGEMKICQKPFVNVKTVQFSDFHLDHKMSNFNEMFPNMKRLEFTRMNTIMVPKCIENHFPHLESLTIIGFDQHQDFEFFRLENLAEALRLNPTLRELRIDGDMLDEKFLESVSENLQLVNDLSIRCNQQKFFNVRDGEIRFANVNKLKLVIDSTRTQQPPIPKIALTFDRLDELSVQLRNHQLNDNFLDFIRKHLTLTKLNVLSNGNSRFEPFASDEVKMRLAQSRSLTHIDLDGCVFLANEVFAFVTDCQTLQKFRFRALDRSDYTDLLTKLDEKWKASIKNWNVVTLELV